MLAALMTSQLIGSSLEVIKMQKKGQNETFIHCSDLSYSLF